MMAGDEVDVLGMIIAEDREGARAADVTVSSGVRYNVDEVLISDESDFLVSGWVADADAPLRAIEVIGPGGRHVFTGETLRRRLRRDVAADLRDETGFHHGFWAYLGNAEPIAAAGEPVSVRLDMGETLSVAERLVARSASEGHVRRQALVFAAIGTPHEEAIRGENRAAEWVRWLSSGPEIARFIAAFEGGYGKALSGARLANVVERKRRPAAMEAAAGHLSWSIDTVVVSEEGGLFVVGWLDDADDPVAALRITGPDWHASVVNRSLARIRREDVETALQRGGRHPYGFWSFLFSGEPIRSGGGCQVELLSTGGRMQVLDVPALTSVSSAELRSIVLTYLANSRHFGAPQVEKIAQLSDGLGEQIVGFNRFISQSVIRAPHVERFVTAARRPKGSIVVCLFGKAEYLFVQAALFARLPGIEDYEFIYVSNSPELVETLLKEARNVRRIYGHDLTLVLLPANAGFGAANNVAARYARSDRILIVNPDVFPKDRDWAAKHTALVESGRPGTRIFGVPLYYDDGSLMHGGMYFEMDTGLSVTADGVSSRALPRVEHYGKGAPPAAVQFTRTRPVPAVTGAFISCDRAWFEALGGFTEDYVFGHYEDADLCLKSFKEGVPAWLQDLRLWHLEGKGSVRLNAHEGGSLVNRWLFSERWGGKIADGLQGQQPTTPLLALPAETAPASEPSAGAAVKVAEPDARAPSRPSRIAASTASRSGGRRARAQS